MNKSLTILPGKAMACGIVLVGLLGASLPSFALEEKDLTVRRNSDGSLQIQENSSAASDLAPITASSTSAAPASQSSSQAKGDFQSGFRSIGSGFENGTKATGRAFKKAGTTMGKGFKKAGGTMGDGFSRAGQAIKEFFVGKKSESPRPSPVQERDLILPHEDKASSDAGQEARRQDFVPQKKSAGAGSDDWT